jgi:hypothetical protein
MHASDVRASRAAVRRKKKKKKKEQRCVCVCMCVCERERECVCVRVLRVSAGLKIRKDERRRPSNRGGKEVAGKSRSGGGGGFLGKKIQKKLTCGTLHFKSKTRESRILKTFCMLIECEAELQPHRSFIRAMRFS